MFTYPKYPQSISENWEAGWHLSKLSFFDCWPWYILYSVLMYVNQEVIEGLRGSMSTSSKILIGVDYFVWIAIASFLYLLLTLRTNNLTDSSLVSEHSDAIGIAKKRFFKVYGVSLLSAVAVFLYAIIIGFGSHFLGFSPQSIGLTSLIFLLPCLFFSLCVPFIFLGASLTDAGIKSSFIDNIKLVWGNWWRIFLTYCGPVIVFIVAAFAAGIIIGMLNHMLGNSEGSASVLMSLVIVCLTIFMMPYLFSLNLVLYNDLKLRKNSSLPAQ